MIKYSEAYNFIISWLTRQSEFSGFRWDKKEKTFIKKTDFGLNIVDLYGTESFDLENDVLAFSIEPYYNVRFNIVHDWFIDYSHKRKSDLKYSYTVALPHMHWNTFKSPILFRLEKRDDFDFDIRNKLPQVPEMCDKIFSHYNKLESLTSLLIDPIEQEGVNALPHVGIDWVFERLALILITRPAQFDDLEKIVYSRLEEMYNDGEPNALLYFHKYPEILNALKSIQF